MTPQEYCRDRAARSGSSFYYSFLFLPPERREAITALYAFCREVDDIVDESVHAEVAQAKLAWWRHEIGEMFAGRPQHPVSRALAPALARFGLERQHFVDIVAGMEMDLVPARYATFDELELYCYRVAATVGLLSARVFGQTQAGTLGFARDLGIAFQLTNIIRDVGEDARRSRVYLPAEDLARFGVPISDILQQRESDAFRELMTFEGERAQSYYTQALAQLPAADRLAQTPSLIMAAIYSTTLREIRADGYRVLRAKTSLPPLRKLWLAWSTWRHERRTHQRCVRQNP